jgi:hypothetical protein
MATEVDIFEFLLEFLTPPNTCMLTSQNLWAFGLFARRARVPKITGFAEKVVPQFSLQVQFRIGRTSPSTSGLGGLHCPLQDWEDFTVHFRIGRASPSTSGLGGIHRPLQDWEGSISYPFD